MVLSLWLLLFLAVWEVNRWAYKALLLATGDGALGIQKFDTLSAPILLGVCIASFSGAGAILAWGMRAGASAVPAAMSLGCVWVSAQVSLGVPWYQLLPSHPAAVDYLIAFVGAMCAPSSAALGAILFQSIFAKRRGLRPAT